SGFAVRSVEATLADSFVSLARCSSRWTGTPSLIAPPTNWRSPVTRFRRGRAARAPDSHLSRSRSHSWHRSVTRTRKLPRGSSAATTQSTITCETCIESSASTLDASFVAVLLLRLHAAPQVVEGAPVEERGAVDNQSIAQTQDPCVAVRVGHAVVRDPR